MRYLNMKSSWGIETVDELDPQDFNNRREFRKELQKLIGEYRLSGMNVYSSQRATKDWRER